MNNIFNLTTKEEISIKLLEMCKCYPMCKFDLRINPYLLDKSCTRVFNSMFKGINKCFPCDYPLLGYISTLEDLDTFVNGSEYHEDFYGEKMDIDGEIITIDENTIFRSQENNLRLKTSMIKDALNLFNYLIYDLKNIN